jgi:predicted DNA-binding transcriptional regulator AlpA
MPRRLVRSEEPPPEEHPPLLYDADAAARMLGGVSTAMVYRFVQHGKLHPIKLGRRSMFTLKELQRFIAEQEAKPGG